MSLPLQHHIQKDGFRLRGTEMSRIDGFSDVVFGFAVTLLVVSLEVPKTYTDLKDLMHGFVPFGISFLLLMLVWYAHYRYFRRFGTEDAGTLWLNGMLLFFVLFYTYPLKFIFSHMFTDSVIKPLPEDIRYVTLLYCGGFTLVYVLITALYANAWRQRNDLKLDTLERKLTVLYMYDEGAVAVIGLLACILTMIIPLGHSSMSTMTLMLIGVSKTYYGRKIGTARKGFPPRSLADSIFH